jgi:hypothetical protein
MLDLTAVAPPPHAADHNTSMWVDEQIWGHRLWDSQSPWLIFLEFLNVAEARLREGRLLDEGEGFASLVYRPYRRMALRNLLFNNEAITRIAENHRDSNEAWTQWLSWMSDNVKGVTDLERDYSFLKNRFGSFNEFAMLIGMLRGSAVESASNKRWTSKFVFPFGPSALYVDLNISAATGKAGREYINFGRTGELLYMMLWRSNQRERLKPHLETLLKGDNAWNQLVKLLQPGTDDGDLDAPGRSCYLPYPSHICFDKLGEDWLNILKLNLPGFDALPHLVTLAAFHIMLYKLTVASDWCNLRRPHMICEVVAPKKTIVRELSIGNHTENDMLSRRAINAYIDAIENSREWKTAAAEHGAFQKCGEILEQRVLWGQDYDGPNDPQALINDFRELAQKRHSQHVANVHRIYGKGAGLVSKRGTNKLRYAPTDGLLKTLLYANVGKRMEFGEFLALMYERYGLIVGDLEVEKVLAKEEFDKKAFQANARRLEQRLGSLGLLKRLSDGCAYVENPHRRKVA